MTRPSRICLVAMIGLLGCTRAAEPPPATPQPVLVAESFEHHVEFFNGMIDEARIYEVGLTANRVLAQFIDDGGSNSCGGIYEPVDLNQDCYIGIDDFILLIIDWMDCTDITNPDCN